MKKNQILTQINKTIALEMIQQNLSKMATLKKTKIVFQDQLSLNAGQKYCRMLQGSILQYFRSALS